MPNFVEKYGSTWPPGTAPYEIELGAIRLGGKWRSGGRECGEGLFFHYQQLQRLLWPKDGEHRWSALILSEFVKGGILGLAGPASSGKSHDAAKYALCTYWAFPNETTILCSTTTREMLDMRIWGEIKKYYKLAKRRFPGLDGHFIESKQMLTTDGKEVEGREFRNGIKGVPCKKGGQWEGLGDYIGVKNKRVILIADESQLMEPGFFDSSANLASNRFFQLAALGNPKDPTDSFGKVCEPKEGWDLVAQGDRSQVWETRFRNGRCLRLVGTDSPNLDYPEGGDVPFPYLIGRRYIREIADTYGTESWQYLCWVKAEFPQNAMERRVITRAMCVKFGAFEDAVWEGEKLTHIFALDAAYGAVGGDRCVGGELVYGKCVDGVTRVSMVGKPILIPVKAGGTDLPEDQIVRFVMEYCEARNIPPQNVFLDGTGRSSLVSAFARLWSPAVNPIEFGGKASERPDPVKPSQSSRESYGKFVTELWFAVRSCIESDQFRGMTEDLLHEGQMRAWSINNANKVDVETKDKTKERLGRSPDLFDMLVSGVEGARRLGFQIRKLGINRASADAKWLKDWQRQYMDRERSKQLTYA